MGLEMVNKEKKLGQPKDWIRMKVGRNMMGSRDIGYTHQSKEGAYTKQPWETWIISRSRLSHNRINKLHITKMERKSLREQGKINKK